MRITTKVLSASTLAAALAAVPVGSAQTDSGKSLTVSDVCADSCMPKSGWVCVHTSLAFPGMCDPLACEE